MSIVTGISVLAFAAIASMLMFGSKSVACVGNYADLNRYDERAMDQFNTDLRQAASVTSCTSTQLQISEVDINTGATSTLTYTYNPTAKTLSRIYGGYTNTLLTGIVSNSFGFTMYQRNPIGGSVSNYVTTNTAVCKVIQVAWKCSRTLVGMGQTETAQSAEIVIRKE
jgi:hypothetical protein